MRTILRYIILFFCITSSAFADAPSITPNGVGINPFTAQNPDGAPNSNPIPEFATIDSSNAVVPINGLWTPTNVVAKQGNLVAVEFSPDEIKIYPREYRVIYRLDYRFGDSQFAIISQIQNALDAQLNNKTPQYSHDYTNYLQKGDLSSNLAVNYSSFQARDKATLLQQYADMNNRGINVNAGDVVNFVLIADGTSIIDSALTIQAQSVYDMTTANTSGLLNNKLINLSVDSLCRSNLLQSCYINANTGKYEYSFSQTSDANNAVMGIFNIPNLPTVGCADNANSDALCVYENGMGLQISLNDNVIKGENIAFTPVATNNAGVNTISYVYTYRAQNSGVLKFSSPSISPKKAFQSFDPALVNTQGLGYVNLPNMSRLQSGRYVLEVSVGASADGTTNTINTLKYEYYISNTPPSAASSGSSISPGSNKFNAPNSGMLWIRVSNTNPDLYIDPASTAVIKAFAYQGSKLISSGIYDNIVLPILSRYSSMMRTIYDGPTGLVRNQQIKNYVFMAAIIYIILYAMYFLLGAIEVKTKDLVVRVIKIILTVNVLFSDNSWEFFNEYVFSLFLNGTNELINIFTSASSSTTNPFGFLDPVFDTYICPAFWFSLLVQLVQFWTGLGFLALLVIAGVTIFFATLLEIVVTYVLAFMLITILIGLAPLFIPMILFEYTKGFFINWLTLLFKYTLQPAILIFIILIFDEFMKNILNFAFVANTWGCYKDFDINFSSMGLNLNIPTEGFCLPFYIPRMNSAPQTAGAFMTSWASNAAINWLNVGMASFMYFTYSIIAEQLVGITNSILSAITIADGALADGVGAIKATSFGKAFEKLSGKEFVAERISKRAPITSQMYVDKSNQRIKDVSIKTAKFTAKAVVSTAKSIAESNSAKAVGYGISGVGSYFKHKSLEQAARVSSYFGFTELAAQQRQQSEESRKFSKDNLEKSSQAAADVKNTLTSLPSRIAKLPGETLKFAFVTVPKETLKFALKPVVNFAFQGAKDIAVNTTALAKKSYKYAIHTPYKYLIKKPYEYLRNKIK